ncbi:MAG TPA: S41 family peptidase [Anaerolineaceae bacterium]|jgi:carboxyl-terminal processing protease|nr:S41 family peptidase [Anaerolineaceae bacterium]
MSKSVRIILILLLSLGVLACAFGGGVAVGWGIPRSVTRQIPLPMPADTGTTDTGTPTGLQDLFAPFWQAWDIVHAQYVDQPLDDLTLMQGAIRGMMDSLGDPHSSYMDPMEYETANAPLEGSYEGIGAWVDTSGDWLTIISPIEGSPAEAAGLKPDDRIVGVDGEDLTGMDPELVRRRVLGPAGSTVILTIAREGEAETFDVTLQRATVILKSVNYEMLDNQIAYIELTTFGDDTTKELKSALTDLMAQNPQGLILDLRNNGGGYLVTAIEVVSQFIGENQVVMYEQFGDGSRQTYNALDGGLALDIPMVVLVNEGSASASEITAGALQDYGRAQLVGVTTYGKGSVQTWNELDDNQGAVRVTIARWLTPKERLIHEVGLTPDVVVEMTDEDVEAGRDPQLEKAIELLLK